MSRKDIRWFVSPQGNDRWSGRLPAPSADGQDGPFATPARALAAVARWRRQGGRAGTVRIQLRGGIYPLSRPLVVTAAMSGSDQHPVIIEACRGERPVLSGGQRIRDWSEGSVNGRACWVAKLPDVAAGKWNFTQLFVDGVRRPRTRLPRHGYYRFTGVPQGVVSSLQLNGWNQGPDAALFAGDDLRRWKNLADVALVVPQLWFESHHHIRSVDARRHCVTFREKNLGTLRDDENVKAFTRYYVENVFEALENPGEWYLDRRAGKLYYLPLPGEALATTEVIAPRLSELVRLAGTPGRPVRQIRFENIAFQHADWVYPPGQVGSAQAAYHVPGAVVFSWAEDCVLYGCEVAHVAQYGVGMETGCSANRVVACAIHDLGAGGVKIGHEWLERVDECSPRILRRRPGGKPMAAVVTDCQIHDGGRIFPSAIGVWIGNAGRNRIRHNHIFNFTYTGISCGWTWGYAPTATVDNRIEHNHIHHINWDGGLSDNGGIYTLGIQPGTVVRGNHIHHVSCYQYGGWGIYPDEGSSEIVFENNLVHHTAAAGFSTHYGRDNVVRNNLFALSGKQHVHPGRREPHRTTIFERNIVCWRGSGLTAETWSPDHFLFRNNLFWNGGGQRLDFGDDLAFEDWLKLGQHRGTVIADPLLLDPDGGDLRLRADSPAFRLGFQPLDPAQAGPRFPSQRSRSYADWPKEPVDRRPIVRTHLDQMGTRSFRVTVENVGRAPATGRLRFRASPVKMATIAGSAGFTFRNLAPGRSKSAAIPIEIAPEAERIWVESLPATAGRLPAQQYFTIRKPEWRIPHRESLPSAAAVAAALAGLPARPLTTRTGQVIAEFRAAVAGDRLALLARVTDAAPQRGSYAWEGSCLEVFTHDPQHRNRPGGPAEGQRGAGIRQSFLLPALRGHHAQGAYQDGAEYRQAAAFQVWSRPTADGYELAALLPLSLLNIQPGARRFGMELRLFTALTKAGEFKPFVLFGSLAPHHDPAGGATVLVDRKALTAGERRPVRKAP